MSRDLIVDGDGHVCEPADLWEKRLPSHLRDRGIRLRWNEDTGYDVAHCEDWIITDRGLAGLGNSGRSNKDLGRGTHYEDLHPAGFDGVARLEAMDEQGLDISFLYPGLGFSLGAIHDVELGIASCRVYNDWMAEYCAADPRRLYGAAALPLQDPAAAAAEARRAVNELGLRGTFVRPNPHAGHPLHDKIYTPVWEALEELQVPLGFHPAGLFDMDGTSRSMLHLMAPGTPHLVILFFDTYLTLANLIYGGVLERHPTLKVLMLESGVGWIAHFLDRLDDFTDSYGWETKLSLPPREYFLRQGYISCDPGETTQAAMTEFIGDERMVWASDFPHHDAKHPGLLDELLEHVSNMEPKSRQRLLGENALELYGIPDPRT